MPPKRNDSRRDNSGEPYFSQTQVIEFLNRLPITSNSVAWITQFKETLLLLFPEVVQFTVSANTTCDLVNPTEYHGDLSIVEHRSGPANGVSQVTLRPIKEGESASERLLADFHAHGYPLAQFHDPVSFDYYLQNTAYLGTIFLWGDRDRPPISSETIEAFRLLEPFIIFALTDIIYRSQGMQPFDQAFHYALDQMTAKAGLSPQERKVVILRLYGHGYDDAAERLNVSVETIRKHMQNIHRKTGTRSIAELFAKYFSPRISF